MNRNPFYSFEPGRTSKLETTPSGIKNHEGYESQMMNLHLWLATSLSLGEISTRLTQKSMRFQDSIRNQRLASGTAPEMLRSYFVGLDWGPRMR